MFSIYAAFIMDLILGDPYWFPHPVRLIGKYISFFEKNIRKIHLKEPFLKFWGFILTMSTVVLTYIICMYLLKFSKDISLKLYYILNIVILWTCIAPRCLQNEAMKIYIELTKGNLNNARKKLSYIVGRDTENLEEDEITRAVVETVAENTSDGVIAPLMYMFIGGAPLAITYKAINTLDSMVGYKEDIYTYFGYFSAKLDDIVNFIPARLTAIFMVLGSVFLKLDYKNSINIIKRDRKKHKSPNAGYPEAAVAGALRVKIGGTNSYFGKLVYKPTIGEELKNLEMSDIKICCRLMYIATIISIIIFSFISVFLRRHT